MSASFGSAGAAPERQNRDGLVRVDVLTGFLGSGKTSLVRRLVESGALTDVAILVNEFAGLPVDQRLIGMTGIEAAVIGDRCLCCIVDGNLRAALLGMIEGRASGRLPPFSRILIETSGLADPAPLLAALASDPMLRPRLRLGRVVTLVDLCHGAASLDDSEEAVAQVLAADVILLTKADLAVPEAAGALTARLAALNPIARIEQASADPFDRSMIPDLAPGRLARRGFRAVPATPRHARIASSVITIEAPVEWARFAAWLSLLLHRHGSAILRSKGLVVISTEDGPAAVMIQSVRHVVHQPEHVDSADGATALVMIARDIAPERLERSFRRHVVGAVDRGSAQVRAAG